MSPESPEMREFKILEHNLQHLLTQKQSFQFELNEVMNAINEVKKAGDEVYKVMSNVMMRTDKTSLVADLEERKKLLEMRINAIEKQEILLDGKMKELRSHSVDKS